MEYYCEHCDRYFDLPGQKMKTVSVYDKERFGFHKENIFEDCCPFCQSQNFYETESEEDENYGNENN